MEKRSRCTLRQKGDRRKAENYRQITLLSNVSKVFERCIFIFNALYKLVEPLLQNQSGFRKEHSTVSELLVLLDDVYKGLDENKDVCSVYIDLEKAFDKVDHGILMSKFGKSVSAASY